MGYQKKILENAQAYRSVKNQERRIARLLNKDSELARLIRMESISEVEKYHGAQDTVRLEEYHQKLVNWQNQTITALRSSISRFGMKGNELSDSISTTYRKDKYGIINRLGFSFARHGIYIHRGAGRGAGGHKGSKWTYIRSVGGHKIPTGIIRTTNPNSLNNMNSGNRVAKPWFDSVIKSRLEELADIITEYWDTMVIDATNIFIDK